MIKKGKKCLKSIDSFGFDIPINFDQKGSTHNTIIGGILSLIYNIMFFLFLGFCIYKTIYHLQDNDTLFSSLQDLELMGPQDYSQMNFGIFISITGPMILNDTSAKEIQQYIQMYAQNSWQGINNNQTQVNFRWCTQKDFGDSEKAEQIFKTYNSSTAYKVLCPDLDPKFPFILQSDNQQQLYSRVDFVFSRCQNSTSFSSCKSNEEINNYLSNIQFQIYRFNQEFDFTVYGKQPTNIVVQKLEQYYPVTQFQQSFKVFQYWLQQNQWSSTDSFFQIGQANYAGTYFDIGQSHIFEQPISTQPGCICQVRLRLYSEQVTLSRVTYSFLNIIADVGGAFSIVILFFQALAFPFSQHSFLIKYVKKLYLAKTKNKKIFKINENKDKIDKRLNFKGDIKDSDQKFIKNLQNEYKSHRIIRFTLWDSFLLYFSGYKCFKKVIPNFKELNIIHNQGLKRIDQDLNIAYIVKELRRLKIASSLNVDEQLNFEIEHSLRNLIDLDREEKYDFDEKQNSKIENSYEDIYQKEIELQEQLQQRNQKRLIRQQQIRKQLQDQIRLMFRQKFIKQKLNINLDMNCSQKNLKEEIQTQRTFKTKTQPILIENLLEENNDTFQIFQSSDRLNQNNLDLDKNQSSRKIDFNEIEFSLQSDFGESKNLMNNSKN